MSKGKDFRPRKRGFDDDGPMPYESRTRQPRSFGPPPDAGLKGAQVTRVLEVDATGVVERPPQRAFGDSPRPRRVAPDPSTAVAVVGHVKWFDDVKGFGFVASDDGGKDVFVHISVLQPAGISHLAEGQQVNMKVVDT